MPTLPIEPITSAKASRIQADLLSGTKTAVAWLFLEFVSTAQLREPPGRRQAD
jgi:hypothetical protein